MTSSVFLLIFYPVFCQILWAEVIRVFQVSYKYFIFLALMLFSSSFFGETTDYVVLSDFLYPWKSQHLSIPQSIFFTVRPTYIHSCETIVQFCIHKARQRKSDLIIRSTRFRLISDIVKNVHALDCFGRFFNREKSFHLNEKAYKKTLLQ